jgi:FMN phosphatase YigB (HAD superfamily)
MQALGITASETWMIGDNLEWQVVASQRLGIYAIWIDVRRTATSSFRCRSPPGRPRRSAW